MRTHVNVSRRTARGLTVASATLALALATTACSSDDKPATTDHPTVVTSTDVWGSVAQAVVGDKGDVISLFHSPDGDPHEFEPSAADTAKIQDGDVLLYNGDHYDAYFEEAAQDSKAPKVEATSFVAGADDHDHDHEATDDDEHDGHHHHHGDFNEHVFYNLAVVGQSADKVADALSEVSPANADVFHKNAADFNTKLTGLKDRLAAIKAAQGGQKVAATEPLAAYLLTDAGLTDVAPASFTAAVEDGQSPSAADVATFDDLLSQKQVKALVYNTQAVDPSTENLLKIARGSGVPVVELTESLPAGVTDYITWQSGQIDQLERALTT
ncbi:MAG: zinc ABC transporter substrate-binding protein [Gordonia sp. (in: high G+C Gram-positive bacteria)]|uniref:metal ABC transporter solute-binding protein, Zn/Mn family n=1 Tax=Gordonia sp. (in: high G+C Gram-positive bacteria) TaxID=84139 RepID=UPI0039E62CF7